MKRFTAKKAGTCYVTVTAKDGSNNLTKQCNEQECDLEQFGYESSYS
ncbi:MAG: hypothetical protein Q4F05_13715 [bacterium]|nr:hypothetical protein [bacterium]